MAALVSASEDEFSDERYKLLNSRIQDLDVGYLATVAMRSVSFVSAPSIWKTLTASLNKPFIATHLNSQTNATVRAWAFLVGRSRF